MCVGGRKNAIVVVRKGEFLSMMTQSMDYKFHLPPQLQPCLLANFFLCYILTHLPQFYALYLCTFGMIHTSCRILNLLDTFFGGVCVKATRMLRLLPPGKFLNSEGLLTRHKNYWVSLKVYSQIAQSIDSQLVSHDFFGKHQSPKIFTLHFITVARLRL